MRILKKVLLILIATVVCLIINQTISKATTVKVTADTLNLREKASTSSNILTLLAKGEKCELIEESGDWYKVNYKTYTGYVSKDYVEKQEEVTTEDTPNTPAENNNTGDTEEITVVTGKISNKSDVKILPLINSSVIDTVNKDTKVTIIAEMSGWTYFQTDKISGWVRSDVITNKKTTTSISNNTSNSTSNNSNNTNNDSNNDKDTNTDTASNNIDKNDTNSANTDKNNTSTDNTDKNGEEYTKKTMYVNDSYVNIRKEPSTSSKVIMVVMLNAKFTVIGESGDWYKVETSEGEAYVSKKLLSDEKTVTTTSRGGIVSTSTTEKTSSSSATTTTAEEASSKGEEIVKYAKQFLGVPYVYGGASKSGFDCSGFTMYVYKKFGISMRHGAQAQAKLGKAVTADKSSSSSLKKNLQPGDLVFFLDYETMDEIGHCGIYIGDGKFIHASSGSGYCVKINSLLPGEYYNTRYCAARRII